MSRRDAEYRPFPEKPTRNTRQETLEVPLFVRALRLSSHSRILEIGCGTGVALPVLQRLCSPCLLAGLDIDENALRLAARRIAGMEPAVELIQADARDIPVESEAFDAVIDFGTCYHIANSRQAVREIERVLKPHGVFATEAKLSQILSHPFRCEPVRLAGAPHRGPDPLHDAPAVRVPELERLQHEQIQRARDEVALQRCPARIPTCRRA